MWLQNTKLLGHQGLLSDFRSSFRRTACDMAVDRMS